MTQPTDNIDTQCIVCDSTVMLTDVNYKKGVVECSNCDSFFHLNDEIVDDNNIEESFLSKIFYSEHIIHVSLFAFMVFWNMSFIIFLMTCINKGYIGLSIVLGAVTALGMYLTYHMGAALFGRSEANSNSNPTKIPIGTPIKLLSLFGGGRTEVISDLHPFNRLVTERYQIARHQNQKRTAYKVRGVNQKGDTIDLVSGVRHEQQVLEIEDKIRNFVRTTTTAKRSN